MFDKMIDSDGTASHGRSRYFIVSGLVIATLFFSAVVLSIYAVDLSLGNDQFELSVMLAPVTPETPEPPQPDRPAPQTKAAKSEASVRNANIPRLDETPTKVPDSVSVEKPTSLARPYGNVRFDPTAIETTGSGVFGPGSTPGGSGNEIPGSSASGLEPEEASTSATKLPELPPAIKRKVPPVVSKGVINGQAKYLPHPPYPAPAKLVGAQGAVSIQITIDESGKVISAKAIDGHPLLKTAAEKAAWQAKFSPTLLSDVPVKVTGVIVYNFKK